MLLDRVAGTFARRARAALLVTTLVVIAGLLLGVGPQSATTPVTPTSGLAAGADSTRATDLLAKQPGGPVSPALVVVTRQDRQNLTASDQSVVATVAAALPDALRPTDLVGRVGAPQLRARVGVIAVPLRSELDDQRVPEVVKDLRARARAAAGGLRVEVTGPPAVEADLSAVFDGANGNLLLTTVIVVAALLLLTYRSPVLWLVPLIAVGLADRASVAVVGGTASALGLSVDQAAEGILSVLVFGAGTDYALLLIARYREELRHHEDRYDAMRRAWRRTAPAVLASGATVVLSLLTLTLADLTGLRGLGYACAVGVALAMVAGLGLLPALLVLLGRWVFWPRVPRPSTTLGTTGSVWTRVGGLVQGRPRAVAFGGLGLLAVLALGLSTAHLGLSADQQFLTQPESVRASSSLALGLPAGASSPLTVVGGDPATIVRRATASAGVATATADGPTVQVVLDSRPGTDASDRAIVALRKSLRGTGALVGGDTATTYDSGLANERDTKVVVPLVLIVVGLVLLILLRSVVAALVLVTTVVISFAGALGAAWLLLKASYGFPAFDVSVPLLSFLFLVALGVDYNIFLIERAREGVDEGKPTRRAMLSALASTGPVITSAGVLLAAVFAVLGVLPVIVLTQIGVIVGLGVLLDTLLVRTLVVPALVLLLGERFWLPRSRTAQVHPYIEPHPESLGA